MYIFVLCIKTMSQIFINEFHNLKINHGYKRQTILTINSRHPYFSRHCLKNFIFNVSIDIIDLDYI